MNRHSGVHRLAFFFFFFFLCPIEVPISPFVNFNHVAAVDTSVIVRNRYVLFCF